MSVFLKQMCLLKSRVNLDLEKGTLSIVEMEDSSIDSVIAAVSNDFNITAVDIVPTVEKPEPVVTEESLEIAKVNFSNEVVEEQLNKLMRIIYWAMYTNKASSRDICQYLMTAGTEIAMRYNPRELVKFSIGDIVDCNYGRHLEGEISGGHVHSIVCDIDDDGTAYVAPITKARFEADVHRYLPFEANADVTYSNFRYTGGTVLLKKGRYVRPERVQSVIGIVHPEFFKKLLDSLSHSTQFSQEDYSEKFSEKSEDAQYDDGMVLLESNFEIPEIPEIPTFTEQAGKAVPNETDKNNNDDKEGEISTAKKKISMSEYLASLITDSLDALDKSKSSEDQVDSFLDSIGFGTDERDTVRKAFVISCQLKNITIPRIYEVAKSFFPEIEEEFMEKVLKDEFKKWLDVVAPEAREKYPTISVKDLLKAFAQKMK